MRFSVLWRGLRSSELLQKPSGFLIWGALDFGSGSEEHSSQLLRLWMGSTNRGSTDADVIGEENVISTGVLPLSSFHSRFLFLSLYHYSRMDLLSRVYASGDPSMFSVRVARIYEISLRDCRSEWNWSRGIPCDTVRLKKKRLLFLSINLYPWKY